MTLVLDSEALSIRVLWSLLSVSTIEDGVKSLAEREGVLMKNRDKHLAGWSNAQRGKSAFTDVIGAWAQRLGLDAVVWTALGTRHPDPSQARRPTCPEVVEYLRTLRYERQRLAEEYVLRTPPQIDTDYRRAIEKELGWTGVDSMSCC